MSSPGEREHKVTITVSGTGSLRRWLAICKCDWTGKERQTRGEAESDGGQHEHQFESE